MPSALEITGDIASAATALAGLILVFIGTASTSFDAYEKQEQHAVRSRYQSRAWIAFIGFAFALLSAVFALLGKWLSQQCLSLLAIALLFVAFIFALFAALSAVREIK